MFTGIIHHLGTVVSCRPCGQDRFQLVVSSPLQSVDTGESIAIDGVCLTVLPESTPQHILFDISPETSQRTTLNQLKTGDRVHLEQALLAQDRIGGHVVTGHIEACLTLKTKTWHEDCLNMKWVGLTKETRPYVCSKGCIALAGVSLTVNEVNEDQFSVMVIPHTLEKTYLNEIEVGQSINVEFDYFAKMIAQQVQLMRV